MGSEKNINGLARRARRSLGMEGGSQQQLLRKAREALGLTNAELAALLGKKHVASVLAWLAPDGAAKHRSMPAGSRMLLSRIMADAKRK